jgi:hypothetical protein
MKTIAYHTVDKSTWGHGPWTTEPDKVQWLDPVSDLPCLMVRNHVGAWCGYVGMSHNHPYYERDYDDCDLDVHGGLTFASKCSHGNEAESICHVGENNEDDNVWWLGFIGDLRNAAANITRNGEAS